MQTTLEHFMIKSWQSNEIQPPTTQPTSHLLAEISSDDNPNLPANPDAPADNLPADNLPADNLPADDLSDEALPADTTPTDAPLDVPTDATSATPVIKTMLVGHSARIIPDKALAQHESLPAYPPEPQTEPPGTPSAVMLFKATHVDLLSPSKKTTSSMPRVPDDARTPKVTEVVPDIPPQTYYWVARTWRDDTGAIYYHYIILRLDAFTSLGGDLTPLLNQLDAFKAPDAVATLTPDQRPVMFQPLELPAPITWTLNKRVGAFRYFLDGILKQHMTVLFQLLEAIISGKHLIIMHYPASRNERIALVHSLLMLLPAPLRTALSFNTSMPNDVAVQRHGFSLVFCDEVPMVDESSYFVFDWHTLTMNDEIPPTAYGILLRHLWEDDVVEFAEKLRLTDSLAFQLTTPDDTLADNLTRFAHRVQLDLAVQDEAQTISTDDLIDTLTSYAPPQGELYSQYMMHLLRNTLDERTTHAVEVAVKALDQHPELDAKTADFFQEALEEQPDDVYAFVRVRCNISSDKPADERWLARLRQAALRSLNLALNDSDAESLGTWLRLLSREPQSFGLADIVRDGVLRAMPRASESPVLVRALLIIALKRTPDLLETLLNDPNVLPSLAEDDDLTHALISADAVAIESLAEESRELFLLAFGRALQSNGVSISSNMVRSLWELQDTSIVIIDAYQPAQLLAQLPRIPNSSVHNNVLETLLRLQLAEDTMTAFYDTALSIAENDGLIPILARVLLQSGRGIEEILIIFNQLISRGALIPEGQIAVALELLTELEWAEDSLSLAEMLARWLNQHTDVNISSNGLWKLLEFGEKTRSEIIVKVAVNRILPEIAKQSGEEQQITLLLRCRNLAQWSNNSHQRIIDWWRQYTREHPLSDLQRLDKVLINQRNAEDLRAIVNTTAALRRTIGQRSLGELAEHISIAHALLLVFADNFDPDNKQTTAIDTDTISDLLDVRADELNPDERQVLVTNLRGLAQLITGMAENRSKPSLIRSNSAIERQIARGEQSPQSAIDLIKWLATHLENPDDH